MHVLGLDIVQYDSATDELTLDLALGDPASTTNLGSIDLPVNFDLLDLAPIASLTSDSTIRLSAGGGLTLTLGVYLGDEGAIALSDSTDLSTLKNGIIFSDLQNIAAPNDVRTVYGQLSADAAFDVSVNGADAVTVTVAKTDTDANTTVDDLVADINAAIDATTLVGKLGAERIAGSNKVALVAEGATTSIALTIANGDPAISQIGLRSGTSATPDASDGGKLKIKAAAEVSGFIGRLTGDAVLQMSLSSVNGGSPVAVVVHKADTDANRNILDVVADVQRAVNAAGFTDKVKVSSLGMGLQFSTLEPGASGFAISAVGGSVAVNELGLATAASGSLRGPADHHPRRSAARHRARRRDHAGRRGQRDRDPDLEPRHGRVQRQRHAPQAVRPHQRRRALQGRERAGHQGNVDTRDVDQRRQHDRDPRTARTLPPSTSASTARSCRATTRAHRSARPARRRPARRASTRSSACSCATRKPRQRFRSPRRSSMPAVRWPTPTRTAAPRTA